MIESACAVCGGVGRRSQNVLWPALVAEWELSPAEAASVDRQQGTTCVDCGSNLRSMVLADAIKDHLGINGPLGPGLAQRSDVRVLEINEAGNLTRHLSSAPGYRYGAYPEIDMQAMPFADGAFDLIVHSDTLEHVHDPLRALAECRRVLAPGGACAFTIPIIPARMNRRRDALPLSFHGNPETTPTDLRVWTEYGADAWTQAAQVGFREVRLRFLDYPDAIAITAVK